MEKNLNKQFEECMDGIVDEFINTVIEYVEDGPYKSARDKQAEEKTHELFNTGSFFLNQYKDQEYHLKYWLYKYFLFDAICKGLHIFGANALIDDSVDLSFPNGIEINRHDSTRIYPSPSQSVVERNVAFTFIVEKGSERIGYKYSHFDLNSKELIKAIKDNHVTSICVIHVDTQIIRNNYAKRRKRNIMNSMLPFFEKYISPVKQVANHVMHITLQVFFEKYLSSEAYSVFISKTQKAISCAKKEIGFQTIPQLTPRFLNRFRDKVLDTLRNWDYASGQYKNIFEENDKLKIVPNPRVISLDDHKTIYRRFIQNGIYNVLVGPNDYSKSFITSEYLYMINNNDEMHGEIDYTSIISGYLKCIEQILYKLMEVTMDYPPQEELWITWNGKGELKNMKTKEGEKNKKYKHIQFIYKNKPYFKTDMGSLTTLLASSNKLWYFNCQDEKQYMTLTLFKWLSDFRDECRNDHFHKDILDDWKCVTAIRENTILLCYVLLGGKVLTGDIHDDLFLLHAYDDTFSQIYRALQRIPSSECKFCIQFTSNSIIKAIRLFKQDKPSYDSYGILNNTNIRFVRVAHFSDFDSENYKMFINNISSENEIIIDSDNIPERIWLQLSDGTRQLVYGEGKVSEKS